MKQDCQIAQDLLPLYEEGLCSEGSCSFVERHLRECPVCSELMASMERLPEPEVPELSQEDKAVKKSFRRLRRRWFSSLIAALLVLPLVLLSVNQYRRQGLCFTNVDDVLSARRLAAALANSDWARVAELMDYDSLYLEIQEILSWDAEHYLAETKDLEEAAAHYAFNQQHYAKAKSMSREEFREYVRASYISDLQTLTELGYTFQISGFEDAYYIREDGVWIIVYGLTLIHEGIPRPFSLHISVEEHGLYFGAMSYMERPSDQVDLAELLFFSYPKE